MWWPILSLVWLATTATVSFAQNEVNISISDQSPMIIYQPTRETWNVSTAGANAADIAHNTSHVTNIAGAAATVKWFGTDMWFWGQVNGSVRLSVDNQTVAQDAGLTNVMACAVGLSNTWHVATLVVLTGTVEVWNASFTVVMGSNQTTMSTQAVQAASGSSISSDLDVTQGNWQAVNSLLTTSTPYSIVSFALPKNSSFVEVYGTVGAYNGNYSVALSTGGPSSGPTPANQTFDGRSKLGTNTDNVVIYYASLDPSLLYMVIITVLTDYYSIYSSSLMMSSYNYTTLTAVTPAPSDTSDSGSSSSSNTGAIVGGVVGGIAALVLIGALVWWWRRRRQQKSSAAREGFTVDDNETEEVIGSRMTPFYEPLPMPAPHNPSGPSSVTSPLVTSQSGSRGDYFDSASVTNDSASTSDNNRPAIESRPSVKSDPSLLSSGQPNFRQEMDAGPIAEEEEVIMPPSYNAAWSNARTE